MPLIRHELCTTSTSYTCVQLDIKFAPQSDLTIALDEEESLWIEIKAKIRKTNVRGVTFKGYLSVSRTFLAVPVQFNNMWRTTVLGPMLFILYINDFKIPSKLFDFHLFADN